VTSSGKALVVGPSWVGDMVMAQALYRLLRGRGFDEIHVVAPPWSSAVLARMPEVTRVVELDVAHGELGLRKRRAVGKRLRAEQYSRAIVLPRSAKAALVPWWARVPRRTGFRGEWRYGLLNDVRRLEPGLDQTVKRFVALGQEPDEPRLGSLPPELRPRLLPDRDNGSRLRVDLGLDPGRPIAALMPGAEYGEAKRWPADYFGAVAAAFVAAGAVVLVLGSAKERPIGEEVVAAANGGGIVNLCGRTSLGDVVDLLAMAEIAVSNDSGLMHVAAATGTPTVAIYGSSSPAFTPPLSPAAESLWLALDCSPCFARECPLGHLRCLRELAPAQVLAAAAALRARGVARGSQA
jgi:heptosyltransferase-2